MLRAIKYELKPNKTQQSLIKQTCGCCRLVYNLMLDRKIKAYELDKTKYSAFDLIKEIPSLKNDKLFLKDVYSPSLQQSILDLDKSFKNLFYVKQNFTGFQLTGIGKLRQTNRHSKRK